MDTPAALVVALLLMVKVPAPMDVTVEPPGIPVPVTVAPTASPAVEETAVIVLLPNVTVPVITTVPVPVHWANSEGKRVTSASASTMQRFIGTLADGSA